MEEFVPIGVQLVQLLAATLREDKMTRSAITRSNRLIAVGRLVISIVATKTAVPVLVSDVVRI
ncbi:MAG TPA: hypothetical protein VFQ78_09870, partial [Candidatus Udaeobacter sp.]|nr:hypothetical protein [Candidatus Udaeobacter sp.]